MEPTVLEIEVVAVAGSYRGVREDKGPNSSDDIDRWLAFVKQPPGKAYCAAAVSCIIHEGAGRVPMAPQFVRSASAMKLLEKNPNLRVSKKEAKELLSQGIPLVFVMDHGKGLGHAGFATELLEGDKIHTLEGNTGPGASTPAKDREGQGYYERDDRDFDDVNGGWIRIA